jgi:hypothetical protein
MSDQRIQDTQRQVDEVVDIMRQNVSQVNLENFLKIYSLILDSFLTGN